MRLKYFFWFLFAISLLMMEQVGVSQVVPSARGAGRIGHSFSVGVGPSSYDVDWGHGRMLGGTVWADYYPQKLPQALYGLGLEAEARDISLQRSSTQTNYRTDTAGGGFIYNWHHYPNLHPYAKFLVEYGSIDFPQTAIPNYKHDTRAVYAPGGGLEYRVFGNFLTRVDYEYQVWETLLGGHPDPQGFTVGVAYEFGSAPH